MTLNLALGVLLMNVWQPPPATQGVTIGGDLAPKPHQLVRLTANDLPPKSAVLWMIRGAGRTWKATTPKHLCEFSAEPGTYTVTLIVIQVVGETPIADELSVTVTVPGCEAPPEPPAKPPAEGAARIDPAKAIVKVQFGNSGCTASAVYPRRPDGRWDMITAAHCVAEVGQRGTVWDNDGKKIAVTVVSVDRESDHAWVVTDDAAPSLWCARMAGSGPPVGVSVWHAGFGVDKPGNREEGRVSKAVNYSGQVQYRLSVSSGDSGGPIFRQATDEIVGVVCCTTERGREADVWAASPKRMTATRPKATATADPTWVPSEIPLKGEAHGTSDGWRPTDVPVIVQAK